MFQELSSQNGVTLIPGAWEKLRTAAPMLSPGYSVEGTDATVELVPEWSESGAGWAGPTGTWTWGLSWNHLDPH